MYSFYIASIINALTGHIQQWITLTHQRLLCSSLDRQIAGKKQNTKKKEKNLFKAQNKRIQHIKEL